jgi:FdhD protein
MGPTTRWRLPCGHRELILKWRLGFCSTRVVRSRDQLRRVSYCVDRSVGEEQRFNIVNVELAGDGARVDTGRLERHFSMTSACGVCGKATLEALHQRGYEVVHSNVVLKPEMLWSLPAKLRQAQKLFETTGGLHAAGLFDPDGELVAVREDVGRHNALDKVVGCTLMAGRLPLLDHVILVSGRSSFELVQKSLSAGVAALCSVSAPSSLAVNLARDFGLTLVGFLRPGRFKLYSGFERVGQP